MAQDGGYISENDKAQLRQLFYSHQKDGNSNGVTKAELRDIVISVWAYSVS